MQLLSIFVERYSPKNIIAGFIFVTLSGFFIVFISLRFRLCLIRLGVGQCQPSSRGNNLWRPVWGRFKKLQIFLEGVEKFFNCLIISGRPLNYTTFEGELTLFVQRRVHSAQFSLCYFHYHVQCWRHTTFQFCSSCNGHTMILEAMTHGEYWRQKILKRHFLLTHQT